MPVEGWARTRTFCAGIERDEDAELRMLDQRSWGDAFSEDGRSVVAIQSTVNEARGWKVMANKDEDPLRDA